MTRLLRIALAQMNPTVGDLEGNADRIIEWSKRAADLGADVVAFPELTITGYPPEDLVLKPNFVAATRKQLERVAREVGDTTAIVGFVDSDGDIYNAAAVLQRGEVVGVYRKWFLPNYAVFDEQRYFKSGDQAGLFTIAGVRIGITICEDIWYPVGPATVETAAGAEMIVNINASPFAVNRQAGRCRMIATRAQDEIAFVAYVNQVGGQDELVFEGASMIFDWRGEVVVEAKAFQEDMVVADLDIDAVFSARLHDTRRRQMSNLEPNVAHPVTPISTPLAGPIKKARPALRARDSGSALSMEEAVFEAIKLGTRDYVRKNGFETAVVGLSGGIDSSVTAAIAVEALGNDHVQGVSMPSRFSTDHSRSDAEELATNLGIPMRTIPIEAPMASVLEVLGPSFEGLEEDITEENLQARLRGNVLMALSNKFGWLVLTTGNKSEVAVGFSTLYGDTAGGFAVLKDVYKTTVYLLAHWINSRGSRPVIPESVLCKPPSAELRADQRDVDRLPPYEVLDPILEAYVEQDRSIEDIVTMGYDASTVRRIVRLVDVSEFKRRQQPPGPRISGRAFGKDRRLPITNGFPG